MQHEHTKQRSRKRAIRIEEQSNQALLMYMAGVPYRRMAETLGVSIGTAHDRVQRAIDASKPHAEFDAYRKVQLSELEVSRRLLRKVIATYGTQRNDQGEYVGPELPDVLATIKTLLALQEREAKLLGLDKVATPIDELLGKTDAEIEALVAEWQVEGVLIEGNVVEELTA